MDDLISRQAAIDAFLTELTKRERKNLLHTWSTVEVKYFITKMLEQLPSAQPMRKEAKWMSAYLDHESMGRRPRILYCSRCNQCVAYPTDFCPACGADMRGEPNE